MNKSDAIRIRDHALSAICSLSKALNEAGNAECPPAQYQAVKRGVGLSIGNIQIELLDEIYKLHPELDHTKARN